MRAGTRMPVRAWCTCALQASCHRMHMGHPALSMRESQHSHTADRLVYGARLSTGLSMQFQLLAVSPSSHMIFVLLMSQRRGQPFRLMTCKVTVSWLAVIRT